MRFLDKRNSFKEFNQSRVLSLRFSGENSSFVDVCHAAVLRGAHDDRVNYRNCKLGFCMGSEFHARQSDLCAIYYSNVIIGSFVFLI